MYLVLRMTCSVFLFRCHCSSIILSRLLFSWSSFCFFSDGLFMEFFHFCSGYIFLVFFMFLINPLPDLVLHRWFSYLHIWFRINICAQHTHQLLHFLWFLSVLVPSIMSIYSYPQLLLVLHLWVYQCPKCCLVTFMLIPELWQLFLIYIWKFLYFSYRFLF